MKASRRQHDKTVKTAAAAGTGSPIASPVAGNIESPRKSPGTIEEDMIGRAARSGSMERRRALASANVSIRVFMFHVSYCHPGRTWPVKTLRWALFYTVLWPGTKRLRTSGRRWRSTGWFMVHLDRPRTDSRDEEPGALRHERLCALETRLNR